MSYDASACLVVGLKVDSCDLWEDGDPIFGYDGGNHIPPYELEKRGHHINMDEAKREAFDWLKQKPRRR